MQQKKKHLAGVQKITFGTTAADRRWGISTSITTMVLLGLAYQLTHFAIIMCLLLISPLIAFPIVLSLLNRNVVEIDFEQSVYYIETGQWPAAKMTGGPLREISHLSMTKQPATSTSERPYAVYVEFAPEVGRRPYKLDGSNGTLPTGVSEFHIDLYLELAERLNVPFYDDSGWNGHYPDIEEPVRVVVQPGETHPVRLQPPKKWNKWCKAEIALRRRCAYAAGGIGETGVSYAPAWPQDRP
jgi:hypothetical protein